MFINNGKKLNLCSKLNWFFSRQRHFKLKVVANCQNSKCLSFDQIPEKFPFEFAKIIEKVDSMCSLRSGLFQLW